MHSVRSEKIGKTDFLVKLNLCSHHPGKLNIVVNKKLATVNKLPLKVT